MHGIVFASLHDYTRARLGPGATTEIFAGRFYSMTEAHPDSDLIDLLHSAADQSGQPLDALVRDFGVFTAEHTFPRLYPAFYEIAADSRSFLLGVETRIHELVRATIPDARPPALRVHPGADGLEIDYSSPRRLCRLLEGLIVGTGHHYGEHLTVSETACMRDGAPSCLFTVRPASE